MNEKKDELTQIYEAELERETEKKASPAGKKQLEEPLSLKATFKLMGGTLLLSLGVGGIFLLVFFLFILFCIYIWF